MSGTTSRKPRIVRGKPLSVYVGEVERQVVTETAKAWGLTASAYLRTLAAGSPPPRSKVDLGAISKLAKVNEDQAKLTRFLSLVPDVGVRDALSRDILKVQEMLVRAAKSIRT